MYVIEKNERQSENNVNKPKREKEKVHTKKNICKNADFNIILLAETLIFSLLQNDEGE